MLITGIGPFQIIEKLRNASGATKGNVKKCEILFLKTPFLTPKSQSVIDRIRSEVFLPDDQLLEQTHVLGMKTNFV